MIHKGILQTGDLHLAMRPLLEVATIALVGLGLLGGWAGSNWPVVLGIAALMIASIILIGRLSGGSEAELTATYASAAINLTGTAVIVIITGGARSPFWLLFLTGSIASAMSLRGRAGVNLERLNASVAAVALVGPEFASLPLDRSAISLAAMEVTALLMTSVMIRRITTLLLASGQMLSESEDRYRTLAEAAHDDIFVVDRSGHMEYVNEYAASQFGREAAEIIGQKMIDLFPPEIGQRQRTSLQRVLESHQPYYAEDRAIFPRGEVWLGTWLSPLFDRAGEVRAVLGISRDITGRRQAEEELRLSQRRLTGLITSVMDGIVSIDSQHKIVLFNPAAERLFGYGAEEILGQSLDILLPERYRGAHHKDIDNFGRTGVTSRAMTGFAEVTGQKRGGEEFPLEASISQMEVGGEKLFTVILRDMTERRRVEEKVQRQNRRLTALREIDTAILAADSVEHIADAALGHIRELISCRRASMSLFDWETNAALIFDVKTIAETSVPSGTRMPLGPYQDMIQTLSKSQPVVVQDLGALTDPPLQIQSQVRDGLRSMCLLPLFSQSKLIGSFSLFSELPGFFDAERIDLGREVANQVAIAITQSNLLEALRESNARLEQRVVERTAALSEANAFLQAMMDNIPDHIYFKDVHGRFIRNSRAQVSMMGLRDPQEAVGKSDFDFFPHAQRAYDEEQEVIRTGQPLVDYEEHVVWPDGRVTWVSTTKMPLRDEEGRTIGIFGISHDITGRKQAEESLLKAKAEAEAANEELAAFSYSVSHDLRAPLRGINGYARLLMEEYAAQLPAEARRHLENIRAGSKRMDELIQAMLQLSRVARQALNREAVSLSKIAVAIAGEFQSRAPQRRVEIVIADGLNVRGDPSLLQVVIENLLDNAWKYTSKREQARIEVGSVRQPDGSPAFFVRDNGVGFDTAYADKLFGAFQRLHSEAEFEGSGIGLATVQRIVHRHSGRVWAEGEVDKGATFYFSLGENSHA